MKYTIKASYTSNKAVSLHSNRLKNLGIKNLDEIKVCIGARQETVKLLEHKDNESTIYMSEDLLTDFTLPSYVQYELTVHNNQLIIGPIIGLLVRGKIGEMTMERIKIYKKYLFGYNHINGLILLFTSDGIDEENKTILGFAYNPNDNKWEEGKFPFPSVVFLRKTIKDSTRRQLDQLIGQKYFNSYVFNKLEMWEWFSDEPFLRQFFAQTVLANDFPNVKNLVDQHHHIYIKPKSGMQGTGIYQLRKTDEGYILSYRLNNTNISSLLDDWYFVEQFLQSEVKLEKYIAQQGISLIKDNGRLMDLRVLLTKDHNGEWSAPGMVTKFGAQDSIVSNISSGGSAEKVWDTLQRIYKENSKEAFKKYMELENLALSCCRSLEAKGLHLAYIGIDIGLDEDKNLWIIEINNRSPDMTIALDADDYQLYYKVKTAPLNYAKWLSGFGGVRNEAL